jgi:hypothetical protein
MNISACICELPGFELLSFSYLDEYGDRYSDRIPDGGNVCPVCEKPLKKDGDRSSNATFQIAGRG